MTSSEIRHRNMVLAFFAVGLLAMAVVGILSYATGTRTVPPGMDVVAGRTELLAEAQRLLGILPIAIVISIGAVLFAAILALKDISRIQRAEAKMKMVNSMQS